MILKAIAWIFTIAFLVGIHMHFLSVRKEQFVEARLEGIKIGRNLIAQNCCAWEGFLQMMIAETEEPDGIKIGKRLMGGGDNFIRKEAE